MLRRLDEARLEQVASGFLLRVGQHHFLVSAAHVLIECALELPTTPNLRLEHAGHILSSSPFDQLANEGDKYDVGCIHLTPDAIVRITALGRSFLDPSAIALDLQRVARVVFVFAGFPASSSKTHVGIGQVVSTPTYIRGEKLSDEEIRSLGHNPKFNFGISYDRERIAETDNNRRVTGPIAVGMSGGPAWLILPDGTPMLIGIGTHYYPEKKVLVASTVAPLVFEAMRRYAGETVSVTVQSGANISDRNASKAPSNEGK